jgi:GNAT superfamily N-acetyltransferase
LVSVDDRAGGRAEPRAIEPQKIGIFRPYADEVPWELLEGCGGTGLPDDPAAMVRIAKIADEVVALYVTRPVTAVRHEISRLVVLPVWRRRGVGRWLLGHAIGLAETKGAREIVVPSTRQAAFFARSGFRLDGDCQRLELTPE